MRNFQAILVTILSCQVGACRASETSLEPVAKTEQAVRRREVAPGVAIASVELRRAFDDVAEVRAIVVNSTAAPVSWSSLKQGSITVRRNGAVIGELHAESPGVAKTIVVPPNSQAQVSFLIAHGWPADRNVTIFGRAIEAQVKQ